MKFELVIDTQEEERVVATVRHRSPLIDEIEALVLKHTGADRIPGYTEDDMKLLSAGEIECVTVLDGRTYAITTDGDRYRLKLRLYELEQMLPPSFLRINKSTLANEARLDRFAVTYSGGVDAVFKCGYRDYVSRRCYTQIKRRFESK